MNLRTEKSSTSGKTYEPTNTHLNEKNGLYKIQSYDQPVDPFNQKTTDINKATTLSDPFKQKVGYVPTRTTEDIAQRKIEPYKGHTYSTYYDYGFPNDKKKKKEPPKPKEPKPEPQKTEPKKETKPKPIPRVETPLPYNATKSISRTLIIMTKNNRVRPAKTEVELTADFY